MKQLTILSISHTNYCVFSSGTEKFIRTLSKNIQQNGYAHLNIFSFYSNSNRRSKIMGINYNDKFLGIYKYKDIIKIINHFILKFNLEITSIHLQHLLNHDLNLLGQCIKLLKVPVCLFVHDYYIVCSRFKLIDSTNQFCGVSAPCADKCQRCNYYETGRTHFKLINEFLKNINNYLDKIIVPSKYVEIRLKRIFQDIADKIETRPHLTYKKKVRTKKISFPIKFAFAGAQLESKGYLKWKQLVQFIQSDRNLKTNFDLFYFGTGKEVVEGVKNIFVSSSIMGDDAMEVALYKANIDCAFVWPEWAETYSYVYYELSANGIYTLSNEISGNICDMVKENGNGHIFNSMDQLFDWISNFTLMRNELNKYVENAVYLSDLEDNTDIDRLLGKGQAYSVFVSTRIRRLFLKTAIYKLKNSKRLKD